MLHLPQNIVDLPPYQPIEPYEVLSARLNLPPERIVKLDANENPYGPSPRALQALGDLRFAHIYPDPESRALRRALADFTETPLENLVAGSGADELIDLLLRILLEPGDGVVTCPPTFGMYSFDTRLNRGAIVEAPRKEGFRLDVQAIRDVCREQHAKILFLATPNNPDGSLPQAEEIDALLDLPLLVVLDEAYIEFAGSSADLGGSLSRIRQVGQRDNLVVLRTFSKWAGLAGLRVGYGAFPAWLTGALWKAKLPYNVNVAASQAAITSLQDLETVRVNVARIQAERERMFARLRDVPFLTPAQSKANFILCRVSDMDGGALKDRLAAHGILVRHYRMPLLQNCIRISVGRPQDTDRLMEALEKIR